MLDCFGFDGISLEFRTLLPFALLPTEEFSPYFDSIKELIETSMLDWAGFDWQSFLFSTFRSFSFGLLLVFFAFVYDNIERALLDY